MKPIFQTILNQPLGNCLQAAIASLLELSLEEVPNFAKATDMNVAADEFLEPLGLGLVDLLPNPDFPWSPDGFHLINGVSPRDCPHVVVGYKGRIVHDPAPDGGGLKTQDSIGLLYWLGFNNTFRPGLSVTKSS